MGAACAQAEAPATANLDRVQVAGKKGEASNWFRAESQHFVVFSDTREEDVSQFLDNLEKFDHLLRIYAQPHQTPSSPEPKLTLYYHASLSDLRRVGDGSPVDAVGLYSSCASGVQGFGAHLERIPTLDDAQLGKAEPNATLTNAFEAYARHFLYRHTDIRTPAWFIDGFALYFSTVRFSERQMAVGRAPQAVANYLRFLGAGRRYSLDYEDVLQGNLANAHSYAGTAGVRLEFETKSWLLTHYMMSSEDNRKRLNRYLLLTGNGASPRDAFERAFDMKLGDLDRVLWRYSLRGLEVMKGMPEALPVAQLSFRTLPRSTGEFVLADAALKACPRPEAGQALLKQVTELAARFPDDALGRMTLSRAQIDWADPQPALARLEADLQDDVGGFEARYLAGMANLKLAARSQGEVRQGLLKAAQQHLQLARGLDGRSPEAALALFKAQVAAADSPDDAALKDVIAAWRTSRELDALAASAALAYAYTGRADDADRVLEALAQKVQDPSASQWLVQWRKHLATGVTRGEILAEMRRDPMSDAPFREWTVDKDSVLQRVELGYGLESAGDFIKEQMKQQSPAAQPSGNSLAGAGGR
jgi:tetratricopeptide (TPR) repeat protein